MASRDSTLVSLEQKPVPVSHGLARWVAAALAMCVLAACAGPSAPDATGRGASGHPGIDPAAQSQVDQLRALPFTQDSAAIVAAVLRDAGVGIYDDGAPDGQGIVQLTGWQVRNLAVEAANGGGVTGDVLAQVAPTPKGAPPIGYLLAAWAISYDSPGARFAHAVLGDQDWKHAGRVVFPKLVLTVFLADAVAYGAPAMKPAAHTIAPAAYERSAVAGGPCSAASEFIQKGVAKIANYLKVNTSGGGLLGFLGTIWNVAVDLAAGVITGLLKVVAAPLIALMVDVFGVLATIQEVTSYLTVWRIQPLTFTPADNVFGVDDQVVTGKVEVHVVDNQLPVPELVVDCAKVVGVDLSKAGSAEGSAVKWDIHSRGLATLTGSDASLDPKRSAYLTYRTGQETRTQAEKGAEHTGIMRVKATVKRNDVERVRQLLTKLLLDQIPASIKPIVADLAQPILDAATKSLAELTDVSKVDFTSITFHGDPPPDDPPAGSGPEDSKSCSAGGAKVRPGHYQGAFNTRQKSELSERVFSGKINFTVAADGALSGTFTLKLTVIGAGVPNEVWHTVNGRLSGTAAAPTAAAEWDWAGAHRWPLSVDHMPAIAGGCGDAHGALTGTFHSGLNDPEASQAAKTMPEHLAGGGAFAARRAG